MRYVSEHNLPLSSTIGQISHSSSFLLPLEGLSVNTFAFHIPVYDFFSFLDILSFPDTVGYSQFCEFTVPYSLY